MNTTINLPQLPADLRARLDALRKDIAAYIDSIDGFPENGDVIVQVSTDHKYPPKFVLANTRRVVELEWSYEFYADLHPVNAKGKLTKRTDHPRFHDNLLEHRDASDPALLYERGSGESYRMLGKHVDYDLEIKPKAKK
jgi:hypothetical protein